MTTGFSCFLAVFLLLLITCLGEKLSSGEDVGEYVRRNIKKNKVMVFAKSYCPYCIATVTLLKNMEQAIDFTPKVLYLDQMEEMDGPAIQMELLEMTGQRTVPNIFIHGEHLGGNAELQNLHNDGGLEILLKR